MLTYHALCKCGHIFYGVVRQTLHQLAKLWRNDHCKDHRLVSLEVGVLVDSGLKVLLREWSHRAFEDPGKPVRKRIPERKLLTALCFLLVEANLGRPAADSFSAG